MAKTHTSSEVKMRWMDKAYHRYAVNLRNDVDKHIIDYIEANKERVGMTQIFREAMEMYIKAGQ